LMPFEKGRSTSSVSGQLGQLRMQHVDHRDAVRNGQSCPHVSIAKAFEYAAVIGAFKCFP
jgi:hypothetical protein